MGDEKPDAYIFDVSKLDAQAMQNMEACIKSHKIITELATALGCPVEAVTVENLKAVVEALAAAHDYLCIIAPYGNIEAATRIMASRNALAPFKTGG